jgi:hypothetical protein
MAWTKLALMYFVSIYLIRLNSGQKGDKKKACNKRQKKPRFIDTYKSKNKEDPKWMLRNKEEALKGALASVQGKRREKNLGL